VLHGVERHSGWGRAGLVGTLRVETPAVLVVVAVSLG
jgi:hypothetical protein